MFNVQPFALGKDDVCCIDFYISLLVVCWHSVAVEEYYALFVTFVVISDLKVILKFYLTGLVSHVLKATHFMCNSLHEV
jgi:hypothetical protein